MANISIVGQETHGDMTICSGNECRQYNQIHLLLVDHSPSSDISSNDIGVMNPI
jgi:hypothetical protein